MLSCQICNQRHKKNYFPLLNPAARALSHLDNHAVEQPVFIHPANENPEDFITFNEEIPVAVNDSTRGIETINKLSLDRPLLNEQRREWISVIQLIYDLANGYPDTNPEIKEKALAEVKKYYESSSLDSTEYAGMKRAFFRKNPV